MTTNKIPAIAECPTPPRLLFLGTHEDIEYTPRLKQLVGAASVFVLHTPIETLAHVEMYCKTRNITGVFTTSVTLLTKLLSLAGDVSKPSLSNYAGSYFQHNGLEYVFIEPLPLLVAIPYQSFLTRRYISKLTTPEVWHDVPAFSFELITASNFDDVLATFKRAFLISVDIETLQENLIIKCIGYTAALIEGNSLVLRSVVLPLDSTYALALARKLNWETPAPKVLQNGKYDCAYLARYNAPLYNWQYDTITMFHCWYSELPKDLAGIAAFFIKKSGYWKDLAKTNDLHEYYKYNALDTYATVLVAIEWLLQAPAWAKRNYEMEFPLVFPCHLSELTGIRRDMERLAVARTKYEAQIEADNINLSKMVGTYPAIFNVNSPIQNAQLRRILGASHITSSDEKSLKKIGSIHPINKRITNKILDLRGDRKLVSTYLVEGKELGGRILWALNPHGTDTGRLASREHQFWCGLQVQNIPRGDAVKQTLIADPGFRLGEVDLSKAESWGTGYCSGDANIIAAVNSPQDFHSINASAFFGVPYDQIYSDALHKTIDKVLRDLAKRVNHGANYLMGANVLVDTMGEDNVWIAKRMLNLPRGWGLKEVAEYLLNQFHATYPSLRKIYYPKVVADVVKTRMLVGGTGWTRWCFGDPAKNKRDLNSYVAHVSQSLNAMSLNESYLTVFYTIQLNPKYSAHFKLLAQIHDSILFQFREGHEYLCDMVRKCMERPITVKGADGVVRTFVVPADIKAGPDGKGALRWSETE